MNSYIKVSKKEAEDVEVQLQFKHLIRASVLLVKEEDLYKNSPFHLTQSTPFHLIGTCLKTHRFE